MYLTGHATVGNYCKIKHEIIESDCPLEPLQHRLMIKGMNNLYLNSILYVTNTDFIYVVGVL
jgi:hypothetical protein